MAISLHGELINKHCVSSAATLILLKGMVEIDPAYSTVLSREKKLPCFRELVNRRQKLNLHDVFAEAAETNLGSVTSF